MSDRQRLEQALIAADAAGDVDAAQQLAVALRGMSAQPEVPAVQVKGDYRDKYAGQSLAQGNVGYILDYIRGIGKAATRERPDDFSMLGGPAGSITGVADTAMHLGTSALAPLFALPDYAITKMGVDDRRNPSGTYAGARSKYVYQPRTSMGQGASELAGAALKPVGDAFSLIGSGYGDIAGQLGASPQVQNEIRDIAPDVVQAGLTIGQLRGGKKPQQQPIPSTDELRKAKTQAYKQGNESTVLTTPEQNAAAITKIDDTLKSENIIVDADLHPKSSALLRRLQAQKDKPLTVPEAESLRQLALEVQRDMDPVTKQPTADAFRAGVILDELDNSLDTLTVNQGARALNSRFRRSQAIDEMIRRAEIKAGANYTQAGMEHALRQEFKQMALTPARMRGLTPEMRAAIEKVAKGGPIENSLRALGKFDPTTGGMAAFIGTGTGGALGGALAGVAGGGVGALALPLAGYLSKRGATKMTAGNVAAAREALVGRGMPNAAPASAVPAATVSPLMLGLRAPAKARPVEQIRQDLARLDAAIKGLPADASLASPKTQMLRSEWARLQAELAAAESAAASQ